jgi:hypothetical protein
MTTEQIFDRLAADDAALFRERIYTGQWKYYVSAYGRTRTIDAIRVRDLVAAGLIKGEAPAMSLHRIVFRLTPKGRALMAQRANGLHG